MTNNRFNLETFIPYRLSVAASAVSSDFSKNYRESHGFSRADWRIICHLSQLPDGEAISVRDLEQRVHLEKSKVSRAVSRLESNGYLTKAPDKKDARLLQIKLTPKGLETFEALVPMANAYQDKILGSLNENEREQFVKTLEKLSRF